MQFKQILRQRCYGCYGLWSSRRSFTKDYASAHAVYVPIYLVTGECDEQQLCLHDGETLSEHNLSIMTQWGKHETVIL